jgi:hypothetical protein
MRIGSYASEGKYFPSEFGHWCKIYGYDTDTKDKSIVPPGRIIEKGVKSLQHIFTQSPSIFKFVPIELPILSLLGQMLRQRVNQYVCLYYLSSFSFIEGN